MWLPLNFVAYSPHPSPGLGYKGGRRQEEIVLCRDLGSRPKVEKLEIPFYPAVCILCPGHRHASEGRSFIELLHLPWQLHSLLYAGSGMLGAVWQPTSLLSLLKHEVLCNSVTDTSFLSLLTQRAWSRNLRTKPHLPSLSMQVNLHISCVHLHSPHMGHLE